MHKCSTKNGTMQGKMRSVETTRTKKNTCDVHVVSTAFGMSVHC